MICPIREDGWCSRHATFHVGRLKELSQMNNVIGEQYRKLWDGLHGIDGVKTNPVIPPIKPPACGKCGKKNGT